MKHLSIITLLFVSMVSFTLAGCATIYNPATGKNELILINTNSEVAIGESAISQIGKRYKVSENKDDLDRLNRIGESVAGNSDRQDLKYHFYLIESDDLNAFTVPGGHVYIFNGLYKLLNDDELACVLAHEVGHAAARHIVKKMQAVLGYQLLSTIALATYTKGREERQKQAAYMAYAGVTAFNLVQLGYSREDEYQADELAVKYAYKAGFDPSGMAASLKKLEEKEKKGFPVPYILRSHPYISERIARTEKTVTEIKRGNN